MHEEPPASIGSVRGWYIDLHSLRSR